MMKLATGSVVAAALAPRLAVAGAGREAGVIRAVAFDAFPIFDPRKIFERVRSILPQQGDAFAPAWFSKIFAYTWLRTTAGQYIDFPGVIEEALRGTFAGQDVSMSESDIRSLCDVWSELEVWTDVPEALDLLRSRGLEVAFLSNMPEAMLRANARRAGIEGQFAHFLTTDSARAYKPSPAAYRLAESAWGIPRSNIAFAAYAGWDAAGAAWFGYPTYWVNRLRAVPESVQHPEVNEVPGLDEFLKRLTTPE